ncbi:MAG TPA: hypothetical protein V6D10_20595 [Trichocoleus sp.]|jgi:hypothetical protein
MNPIEQTEQAVKTVLQNDADYLNATSEMLATHAATLPQRLLKTTYRKVGDRFGSPGTFLFRLRAEGLTPILELRQWALIRELLIPVTLEGAIVRGSVALLIVAGSWHVGSKRYAQWRSLQPSKPQVYMARPVCQWISEGLTQTMPLDFHFAGRCPIATVRQQ